jgi:hypothetical protein
MISGIGCWEVRQQAADMREPAHKPEYLSIRETLLQSADEQAARSLAAGLRGMRENLQ